MARRFHIATIIGARPQFLKAAPLSPELRRFARETVIHTGQHYDWRMSGQFFTELRIPKPTYNLHVGSGSHAEQTAAMMTGIEHININNSNVLIGQIRRLPGRFLRQNSTSP